MRTTILRAGNRSAHASYGPRSHLPQVTGSRQNQPTVVKRGKRIGSWTSNECNSWLNGYLPSRPGASLAAEKLTISLTTSSKCSNTRRVSASHLMSAGQLLLSRGYTQNPPSNTNHCPILRNRASGQNGRGGKTPIDSSP